MRLRVTPRAAAELDGILAYAAARSPQGARRVQSRILALTILLARHPYSGQQTRIHRVRRIVTTPYPYVIFYEVADHEIIVIGVRHVARDTASAPEWEPS